MKRKVFFIALLILSLPAFLPASGCGKKGPPLPPEEEKGLTSGEPAGQTPGRSDEAPPKNSD